MTKPLNKSGERLDTQAETKNAQTTTFEHAQEHPDIEAISKKSIAQIRYATLASIIVILGSGGVITANLLSNVKDSEPESVSEITQRSTKDADVNIEVVQSTTASEDNAQESEIIVVPDLKESQANSNTIVDTQSKDIKLSPKEKQERIHKLVTNYKNWWYFTELNGVPVPALPPGMFKIEDAAQNRNLKKVKTLIGKYKRANTGKHNLSMRDFCKSPMNRSHYKCR